MKTTLTSLLLIAVAATMTSCSTTNTKIDTGSIEASTFSFVNTRGKPVPDYAEKDQQIHALIQSAITQSLANRQVTRVENGGDVTVAYMVVIGNNVATTSINDHFGYGRDAYKLAEKAHAEYTSSSNPNYFEAGTLLIDIVDSKSWKILKRGHATRVLVPNQSPEARTARMNAVVEEILADVRFKQ